MTAVPSEQESEIPHQKLKKFSGNCLFRIAHFGAGVPRQPTLAQWYDGGDDGKESGTLGLVGATRFFGQQVAGHGVSASARTTADLAEGTSSALPFQLGTVAKGHK